MHPEVPFFYYLYFYLPFIHLYLQSGCYYRSENEKIEFREHLHLKNFFPGRTELRLAKLLIVPHVMKWWEAEVKRYAIMKSIIRQKSQYASFVSFVLQNIQILSIELTIRRK